MTRAQGGERLCKGVCVREERERERKLCVCVFMCVSAFHYLVCRLFFILFFPLSKSSFSARALIIWQHLQTKNTQPPWGKNIVHGYGEKWGEMGKLFSCVTSPVRRIYADAQKFQGKALDGPLPLESVLSN
jgi:hypothetical protein